MREMRVNGVKGEKEKSRTKSKSRKKKDIYSTHAQKRTLLLC